MLLGRFDSQENLMKALAIVVVIVGLAISAYNGFTYMTEGSVQAGEIQAGQEKENSSGWDPFLGASVTLIGVTLMFMASQKTKAF